MSTICDVSIVDMRTGSLKQHREEDAEIERRKNEGY